MRRRLFAILTALTALIASAVPATAITGNYVDDPVHTNVGLITFQVDGEFAGRCTGTMISSHVMLTAGHCVEGAETARVYFHQDAGADYDPATQQDPTTGYPDFCIDNDPLCFESDTLVNYGYPAGFPETKDLGLVIFDEPVGDFVGISPLAQAGSLDALATARGRKNITFTASGYGVTAHVPRPESYRVRLQAISQLTNLRNSLTDGYNLQTTAGQGRTRGGTCNGDSGGPIYYGDARTTFGAPIVAVTSFGLNANCKGTDFSYRTDQAAVIAWIQANLPEGDTITLVPLN